MVNRIWWHFAALPGALDWAWTAVRPLVGSKEMHAARAWIREAVARPALVPPGRVTWRGAGLDAAALPGFAAMMKARFHGKLTNIAALTALGLRLDAPALGRRGSRPRRLPRPRPRRRPRRG